MQNSLKSENKKKVAPLLLVDVLSLYYQLQSSLVEILGLLMYTIVSSTNSNTSTASFQICISLIFSNCLIALARTSSTALNRYEKSGQTCFVTDLRD